MCGSGGGEVVRGRGVLVFLKFGRFSRELKESEVSIGNLNVKAINTTEYKLHKIWRPLKF